MLEEKLIKEVQRNECLWNKYNADYKNKRKRDIGWSCVSNSVGDSVENCRKRWKSLRDRFVLELSLRNKSFGYVGNDNAKREWLFFEQLFFLTTSMSPKGAQIAPALQLSTQPAQQKCSKPIDSKDNHISFTNSTKTMEPDVTSCVDAQRYANLDETTRTLLDNYLTYVNAYKQSADPFLAVIQGFFDQVPQQKRVAFKMDILNYTYKMYAEIKD